MATNFGKSAATSAPSMPAAGSTPTPTGDGAGKWPPKGMPVEGQATQPGQSMPKMEDNQQNKQWTKTHYWVVSRDFFQLFKFAHTVGQTP